MERILVIAEPHKFTDIEKMLVAGKYPCVDNIKEPIEALYFLGIYQMENRHVSESAYDLLIIDNTFKVISGLDICRFIKNDLRYSEIPILVLADTSDASDYAEAFRLHIHDYLIRPLSRVVFLSKVRSALYLREKIISSRNRERELSEINKKMIKDLNVATRLQMQMLPDELITKTIQVSGLYRPVEHLGGDLYYWKKLKNGKTAVVLLDIMGHGTATSMICMYIRSKLSELMEESETLEAFIVTLNELMIDFNKQIAPLLYFCSAFYMVIDEVNGSIQFVNAGHPPAACIQGSESVKWLELGCPPLGILKTIKVDVGEIHFTKDTRVLLYSDGIYDLFKEIGIDIEYFLHFSKFYSVIKLDETKMIEKISSFVDQMPHRDDISLVYIEIAGRILDENKN